MSSIGKRGDVKKEEKNEDEKVDEGYGDSLADDDEEAKTQDDTWTLKTYVAGLRECLHVKAQLLTLFSIFVVLVVQTIKNFNKDMTIFEHFTSLLKILVSQGVISSSQIEEMHIPFSNYTPPE